MGTNIAETSITIPDCVYVIDCGRVKENRYDALNKMPQLTECLVSKASSRQRRGRAGRVKPGRCFKMFTHRRVVGPPPPPVLKPLLALSCCWPLNCSSAVCRASN